MSINFTGVKNMGAINVVMPIEGQQMSILSFQVSDDDRGNDLTDFKKALEKSENPKRYLTAFDEGLISLNVIHEPKEEEYEPDRYNFYLNGSKLDVNDKNLALYSFLANATSNICSKKDNEFKVEDEYVRSEGFIKGTSIGHFIKNMFVSNPQIDLGAVFNVMHNKENVKNNSQLINDAINTTMYDYFA